jgi:LysM repeat protein
MPVGFRIASAWVDIRAEDKGLRQQIKNAVQEAVRGQDAKINLEIITRGLRKQVETALKEATKGQKPQVAIGIRSTGLRKEVTEALKKATEKQKPTVRLGISTAGLRAEVQRALKAATEGQKPTVKLGISSIGLRGEVQRALTAATKGQKGSVTIDVDVDTDKLQRALADTQPIINPEFDLRRMRQNLNAAIRRIKVNEEVTINTNIDGDALGAQIQAEMSRLRDRYRVPLTPDFDANTFTAALRRAARQVKGSDLDIPAELNPRINQLKLRAEAAKAFRDLQGKIKFEGEFKDAMLAAQVKAAQARLNAMPHNLTFRARIDIDNAQVLAKLAAINTLVDRSGGKFSRWAKIVIASALLIPPALSVVDHALRSTGASMGVLLAYTTTFITMGVTMAVGMNNVVNAITNSSDSINKYYEYLDQLTPAARQFVETVVNMDGVFKELQATVQETMFSGLAKEIREMAEDSIPSFTIGMGGMALVLNGMAKETFRTTSALSKMGVLDKMFGGMQLAMEPLVPIPGQLLNAIVKMTTASLPVVIRMNQAFANWADTMTYRINNAFNDGTLQAGIQKSADSIVNFFRSIANNPQFNEFMDRIKANGPAMAEAFGNIAEAAMKIVNALAPVNGMIIAIANAFAQFINALPVEVLSLVIAKLVLFKSALLISALVLKLSDAFLMLRTALFYVNNQAAMTALITPRLAAMGLTAPAIARVATAMRLLGKAISGVLIITTIFWVFDAISDRAKGAAPDVDKLSTSLKNLATTGKATGEFKKTFGDIDGFVERLDKLMKKMREHKKDLETGVFGPDTPLDDFGQWIADGIAGLAEGEDSLDALKDDFKSLDTAFADLVNSGYGKLAAKDMGILAAAWTGAGHNIKDLKDRFPEYKAALEAAEAAQKVAADSMGLFGEKANEVSDRIATLKQETEGLVKSLFELNGIQRDANQAVRDAKDAAEAMVKATKAKHLNLQFVNGQLIQTTKAERDAAASMEDYASKTEKSALATYTATGSWDKANKILTDNKAAIIKAAQAAGMGAEEAKLYAESILKIPSKKEIQIMVADQASGQLKQVAEAYRAAPDEKVIKVQALNTAAIESLQTLGFKVRQLPDGQFEVTAKTAPAEADLKRVENFKITDKMVEVLARITELTLDIDEAQQKVDSLKQKRKTAVGADKKKLDEEIEKAQKKVDGLKQKRAAEIKALDKTKDGVDKAKANIDSVKGKQVTISILTHLAGPSVSDTADAIRKQAEAQARAAKNKWTGGVIRRAHGGSTSAGPVVGPGGPKSDRIAALLSNGEYVIRASSVNKYGMGMMNAINQGRFQRYAVGGPVTGSGGASAAPGVKAGATTGTFTIKDETGKPVASAVQNFKVLQSALGTTYTDMSQKTTQWSNSFAAKSNQTYKAVETAATAFGRTQQARTVTAKNQTLGAWNQWKAGMTSRTNATYKALGTQASGFQRTATTRTTGTKNATVGVWNAWGKDMQSRTNSTYSKISSATSSFSKQSTSKIGQARDGMGSAWGGLSPKFKPPVSYLIHTVINKGVVGSMNAIMSKLGGGKKVSGIGVAGFATGGPVYGAGSKTSDSIPARLSNGEFVMQAKAVDKFGVGFMNQVNQGKMPHDGAGFTGFSKGGGVNIKMAAPGFATGGVVGIPSADALNKILGDGDTAGVKRMTDYIMDNYVMPLIDSGSAGSAMKDVQRAGMQHIRKNVESFVKENFGGAGSAAAGLRWAKTQHGKPYQWGGNGNPSWDCSGFMSAIESVIRGEKPHRRWSTHAFQGGTPPGWKAGANRPFRVGITHAGVGHTAGTIGKTNVESSGNGVQVGSGARGYNHPMFTSWYGYVGPNATKAATGGLIRGKGTATSDSIPAWLSNGEYVIRAAAARKLGTGYLNALNSGKIAKFGAGGKVTSTSAGTQYKIAYGDTLSEIAAKYGTTVSALMALNSTIKNANKIYAGQTIWLKKIAGGGGTTPKPPAGGFYLPSMSKVGKSGIQSADGVNALKGFVTISQASIEANKAGANIRSEIIGALRAQESWGTLQQNFYELQNMIKAAFKGSAETSMLSRMNTVIKALTPLQKNLDGVNKKLEDAQKNLEDVQGKFDSLKDSVSGAIMDFGSITKIGKWGTSGTTLLNQLQTDVNKSNAFAKQLEQLKAKGVSADLIGQIAEAGITGGGAATAATILNMTPEQLKQLNSLQAQLTSAANKAGTAAADGMYGAGLNAAKGLVKGLQDQQDAIEAQMLKIAEAMEKVIKQALGIKSPSRVMMQVADFTADGLVNQLIARKADAEKAIVDLVHPGTRAISGTTPAVTTGTIGHGSPGTTIHIENINVCVEGTFALDTKKDREALAKALAKDIKEEIRRDDKKRR